jgi:hypothetical protein
LLKEKKNGFVAFGFWLLAFSFFAVWLLAFGFFAVWLFELNAQSSRQKRMSTDFNNKTDLR